MTPDKFQKRIKQLFEDMENVSAQPGLDAESVRRQLDVLRERVAELERDFLLLQSAHPQEAAIDAVPEHRPVQAPLLYGKEQIGYASDGRMIEPIHSMAPLDPGREEIIQAPLIDSGKAIGAMLLEPPSGRTWRAEETDLAMKVAQQVSLQIQNLRLLEAADRARRQAEDATRQFAHKSWDSFLDAIHQQEQVGYAYNQNAVEPVFSPSVDDADYQEAVPVLDEQVGRLLLQTGRPLTDAEKALVNAVARQLGQQVENLRLLADASRARAEAEDASRRLARDSWKDYVERTEETLGFVYDSIQVTPFAGDDTQENITFSRPLMVHGEPIGLLAIAEKSNFSRDDEALMAAIAERASAHLEALRLNEELQKRAQELQELDRLKSSFLANMSHELRTPLNSILGFSDVMLEGIDGELTDYMENDLKLIQKNGRHLLHLINDVLDMAKIESGRMNLHPEMFKVHDLLDEVTSITSTLASEKNLALFIEEDSDKEIEIFADITRIRQVIINLVNNSIKFTEVGKIKMRVDKIDAESVMISVKDTGLGVPEDHLETIFQEFSQVDTSTTRKVGGTGLGLPISRRLVEMHGGRMWAESTGISGEGTQMYVILPLQARLAETVEQTTRK